MLSNYTNFDKPEQIATNSVNNTKNDVYLYKLIKYV